MVQLARQESIARYEPGPVVFLVWVLILLQRTECRGLVVTSGGEIINLSKSFASADWWFIDTKYLEYNDKQGQYQYQENCKEHLKIFHHLRRQQWFVLFLCNLLWLRLIFVRQELIPKIHLVFLLHYCRATHRVLIWYTMFYILSPSVINILWESSECLMSERASHRIPTTCLIHWHYVKVYNDLN